MKKLLFAVVVSLSLSFTHGYVTLNRFDPRARVCCGDSKHYYRMAEGDYGPAVAPPFRFRPLVPSVAHAFGVLIRATPTGSWDRVFLSLLVSNALFMALTAILLVRIAGVLHLGDAAAMLAVFVHHTNFAVVNDYPFAVDSAEAMFMALTVWLLLTRRLVWLILLMLLAPLAKETTPVFVGVFAFTAVLAEPAARRRGAFLVAAGALLATGMLWTVQSVIGGPLYQLHQLTFANLEAISPAMVFHVVLARSLFYSLAPIAALMALARRRATFELPRGIGPALAVTATAAVCLGIYGRVGENIARPAWSIVGWWASLRVATAITDRK